MSVLPPASLRVSRANRVELLSYFIPLHSSLELRQRNLILGGADSFRESLWGLRLPFSYLLLPSEGLGSFWGVGPPLLCLRYKGHIKLRGESRIRLR